MAGRASLWSIFSRPLVELELVVDLAASGGRARNIWGTCLVISSLLR